MATSCPAPSSEMTAMLWGSLVQQWISGAHTSELQPQNQWAFPERGGEALFWCPCCLAEHREETQRKPSPEGERGHHTSTKESGEDENRTYFSPRFSHPEPFPQSFLWFWNCDNSHVLELGDSRHGFDHSHKLWQWLKEERAPSEAGWGIWEGFRTDSVKTIGMQGFTPAKALTGAREKGKAGSLSRQEVELGAKREETSFRLCVPSATTEKTREEISLLENGHQAQTNLE